MWVGLNRSSGIDAENVISAPGGSVPPRVGPCLASTIALGEGEARGEGDCPPHGWWCRKGRLCRPVWVRALREPSLCARVGPVGRATALPAFGGVVRGGFAAPCGSVLCENHHFARGWGPWGGRWPSPRR